MRISHPDFTTVLKRPYQRCVYVHGLGRARIADFGIAPIATIVGSGSGQVDTPQRTVPEVLKGGPHTKESDIFSFGMLMIEVCHGRSILMISAGRVLAHLVSRHTGVHRKGPNPRSRNF